MEEGLINSFWGTGQDDFVEAITFGLGRERLIKFQEAGGQKWWIFQEAENVLNEVTEA